MSGEVPSTLPRTLQHLNEGSLKIEDVIIQESFPNDVRPLIRKTEENFSKLILANGVLNDNNLTIKNNDNIFDTDAQGGENVPTDDPYYCETCDVRATGKETFKRHLEGRKHIKRVERKGKKFICDVCDVEANSQIQLEIHLRSTKHKNKIKGIEQKGVLSQKSFTSFANSTTVI